MSVITRQCFSIDVSCIIMLFSFHMEPCGEKRESDTIHLTTHRQHNQSHMISTARALHLHSASNRVFVGDESVPDISSVKSHLSLPYDISIERINFVNVSGTQSLNSTSTSRCSKDDPSAYRRVVRAYLKLITFLRMSTVHICVFISDPEKLARKLLRCFGICTAT